LDYFSADYQGIHHQITNHALAGRSLYNGNIASMSTYLRGEGLGKQTMHYHYDQLNRITQSYAEGVVANRFMEQYQYDGDGNIQTLLRHDIQGKAFDNFKYEYKTHNHQLTHVTDAIGANISPDDIDSQTANNFEYDAIGNLVKNKAEDLIITWNVTGKVAQVQKSSTWASFYTFFSIPLFVQSSNL
jgi:hypothetical protein